MELFQIIFEKDHEKLLFHEKILEIIIQMEIMNNQIQEINHEIQMIINDNEIMKIIIDDLDKLMIIHGEKIIDLVNKTKLKMK
jgi:hypothetical protein